MAAQNLDQEPDPNQDQEQDRGRGWNGMSADCTRVKKRPRKLRQPGHRDRGPAQSHPTVPTTKPRSPEIPHTRARARIKMRARARRYSLGVRVRLRVGECKKILGVRGFFALPPAAENFWRGFKKRRGLKIGVAVVNKL